MERETLWQRALVFYKATPRKDLYKRLSVTFEGYENAVDAGALRIEFFGDLMRQVNSILFEGKEKNRVPLHSWDKVHLLQMGGLMLAHSILQKGPGMPTLASYVYEFISSGEKSKAVALITEDDLPDTPQNKDLSDFLKKVHYVHYIYVFIFTIICMTNGIFPLGKLAILVIFELCSDTFCSVCMSLSTLSYFTNPKLTHTYNIPVLAC